MNAWKFITERFPLKVTLPLVAILCLGPLSLVSFHFSDGLMLFASIFLGLLSLRMADDLASMAMDRLTHPNRGLPSARIDAAKLKRALILLVVLVVSINLVIGAWGATLMITSFYVLYFLLFKKLPVLYKPFFSNLIFCCIPLYIADAILHKLTLAHLLLGLFSYLSVVAHEYAHSVHGGDDPPPKIATYATLIGARPSAMLSLLLFSVAAIFGFIFWHASGRPLFFMISLMAVIIHIIYLEFRLIREPASRTARPFYIYGFTFFLIPYAGLVLDQVLSV